MKSVIYSEIFHVLARGATYRLEIQHILYGRNRPDIVKIQTINTIITLQVYM